MQKGNKAVENMNKANKSIKAKKIACKTAGTTPRTHIQQAKTPQGDVQFICTICRKSFRSRSQQYYHFDCGNPEAKKYKCTHCQKGFSSSSHLNYHLDTHHSSEVYHCDRCERTFANRTVLKKHQKLHGTASIPCEQCDKTFRCKATLTAHVAAKHQHNLHFQCTKCEKKYAVKSSLQQHMLKHSAKQHECCYCSKRFQRNSTLKLHLQRHSKTTSFVCTRCQRTFSDEGALLRHAKVHEAAVVKYRCTLCDTSTKRKDNMLRHVRNMHMGHDFEKCVKMQLPTQLTAYRNDPFPISPSCINEETATQQVVTVEEECAANLPKTVANSCVIKRIGNVEPIKVPVLSMETNGPTFTTLQTVRLNIGETASSKQKKVKEKYNPIEMYKKILIADVEDELEQVAQQNHTDAAEHTQSEKPASGRITVDKPPEQQRVTNSTPNVSNFSEMHWRKNFKFTYEYQEC